MKAVNFKSAFVKSGSKTVSEATPQVVLTSTYNSFKLNNLAMATLGISAGDRVVMFDNFDPNEATPIEERFLIAKADFEDENGVEQGALVSGLRGFNYSRIYGVMLLGDEKVQSCSLSDLQQAGKVQDKIALSSITMELVPYQDEPVEIAEGVERMVYKLVNWNEKAHTPKGEQEEVANVEVED
jgi:hypothetical protein